MVWLYSFFNLGVKWWWVVSVQCHVPAALPHGKERNAVPIVQEAWAPGQVWLGVENLASLTFEP